jgi:hypothetical protein
LLYYGAVVSILIFYNASIYADIENIRKHFKVWIINRFILSILTGFYASTIGILIMSHHDFGREIDDPTEYALTLVFGLFGFGTISVIFFGTVGAWVIKIWFKRHFDR